MDVRSISIRAAALVVLAPALAVAAPKRAYIVEITPAQPELAWRAEAITQTLASDLADDRLALHSPVPGCARGCPDAALHAAGVELVVRCTLDAGELRYELRPLWSGAPPPARGAIVLGRLDRPGVAGVLRDRLHRLARTTTDDTGAVAVGPPDAASVIGVVALAAALLAFPFGFAIVRGRGVRRVLALPATRRTILGLAGLGGTALALAVLGAPTGAWFAAGGLAWGWFATVTMPLVFPPLVGLGRSDHEELARVLRVWLGAVAIRAPVAIALYAPVALVAWLACDALDVDPAIAGALAIPLAALLVRHCIRCWVAVAALALDDALVDPTDADAWDAAVRAYAIGYLHRTGLPVDDGLFARTRFLPGKLADIAVYGGGLTHSRIVIPRRLLELALAPAGRPHDYAAPRVSTLHWTQWNAGLVMATEPGAPVATRADRQPRETTLEASIEFGSRELLGEPPTLAGVIEPFALDPRRAYRPHDDPMFLDWDPGEEYDGTDAGDRDFLFGLVAHALAQIQRHADRPLALAMALPHRVRARVLRAMPAALGDVHTALGGARHHLVQWLAWQLWQREDLLTARAYAPELETMSRRILGALDAAVAATTPAPLRRRLHALAPFVHAAPTPATRWRRAAIATAVLAGAGVAGLAIVDAVRYHATYVARTSPPGEPTQGSSHGR
jgi:hypothetical protein